MLTNFAILDLSTVDLIIILAVVLLLFGAKRLPELSRSVGSSLQELRKGLNDDGNAKQKDKQQQNEEHEQHHQ